jgi:hypothetical protein
MCVFQVFRYGRIGRCPAELVVPLRSARWTYDRTNVPNQNHEEPRTSSNKVIKQHVQAHTANPV